MTREMYAPMRRALRPLRVWLLLALMLAEPAWAQSANASLATGLEAQYRAAIVRERRLADERELRLIAAAETRMRAARAALAAAQGDGAAAERELETARAEYVRLVNRVPLRDAINRIEIEAFRAEIEGRLPDATPELLAAYRAFADGDRAAAWITLESLLRARAAARISAARAAVVSDVRQLAGLREVMRVNGEAGATDVLALWSQAAELDSTDFWTHYHRARLGLLIGDVETADSGAQAALRNAGDVREISIALNKVGEVRQARGDTAGAIEAYRESLSVRRRLAEQASDASWLGAGSLIRLGGALEAIDDREGALAAYEEALELTHRAAAAPDASWEQRRDVHVTLIRIAQVLRRRGEVAQSETRFLEALAGARRLVDDFPSNVEVQRDLSVIVVELGNAEAARGDQTAALTRYREALVIRRQLARADAASPIALGDLSVAGELSGDAHLALQQPTEALAAYREALDAAHQLAALPRAGAGAQRAVSVNLNGVGDALLAMGEAGAARDAFREALEIARVLQAAEPQDDMRIRDLALSFGRVGDAQRVLGELTTAAENYDEAVRIGRSAASAADVVASASARAGEVRAEIQRRSGLRSGKP